LVEDLSGRNDSGEFRDYQDTNNEEGRKAGNQESVSLVFSCLPAFLISVAAHPAEGLRADVLRRRTKGSLRGSEHRPKLSGAER
jgi:hypothetical protein